VERSFIIYTGVKEIVQTMSELLLTRGEINIGYDDIKDVLCQQGPVSIAIGTGTGKNRTLDACQVALSNSLIDASMTKSARRVLLNITGPSNLLLKEVNDAVDMVKERMATSAEVIFSVNLNGKYDDEVKVILLAGGISS